MREFPMQPIVLDKSGVVRFRRNAMVRFLLDWATERGMGLSELAMQEFSVSDREQFAQLIGYSVSGFGGLSYVREETAAIADKEAEAVLTKWIGG